MEVGQVSSLNESPIDFTEHQTKSWSGLKVIHQESEKDQEDIHTWPSLNWLWSRLSIQLPVITWTRSCTLAPWWHLSKFSLLKKAVGYWLKDVERSKWVDSAVLIIQHQAGLSQESVCHSKCSGNNSNLFGMKREWTRLALATLAAIAQDGWKDQCDVNIPHNSHFLPQNSW